MQIVNQVALNHGFYRFEPSSYVLNAMRPAIVLACYKDNLTEPPRGLTVDILVIERSQQSLPEISVGGEDLSSGTINDTVDALTKRLRREIPAVDFEVKKIVTHGRF